METHADVQVREITTTTHVSNSSYTVTGTVSQKPEQDRIHDNVISVVYDHHQEHNELIVESENTQLTLIVVTEETDEPKLNLGNLIDQNGSTTQNTTLTYPNTLDMDVVFDNVTAAVSFPAETTMTGPPDWDGVINLPVFTEMTNVTVNDPDNTVTSVLTIGLDDNIIGFDKPVSITFDGKAGQLVGFMRGDEQTMIDITCNANDPVAVSQQLAGSGECKIDSGADLVVWTYHFTEFFTISTPKPTVTFIPRADPPETPAADPPEEPTIIETPSRTGSGGSNSGGGGGILIGTTSNAGPFAELDFEANGVPTGQPLRLEIGDSLTIHPRIMPEDYEPNIYKMDVSFHNGTMLSAWVQYSIGSIVSSCEGAVSESYRLYACDNASILSNAGPSYAGRQGDSTMLFDSITIPFDGEFSGRMGVELVDTRGLMLHDDSYAIDMIPLQTDDSGQTVVQPDIVNVEPVLVNVTAAGEDLAPNISPEPETSTDPGHNP